MDITTVSKIILTAEDKTGPAFTSAEKRGSQVVNVLDELTKQYGPAAAAAIKMGMDAERAFGQQLQAMQRTRAEMTNMQRTLDSLGSGNRDIARAILGTRGTLEISNEIKLINSALESLKRSANIGPQELARASEAARVKVAALRAELDGVPGAAKNADGAMSGLVSRLGAYVSVAAALAGGYKLAQEFIETADAVKLLQARLAVVTGSQGEGRNAFAGLAEDAKRLRAPIEEVVGSFARIAGAVRELGGTTTQARQLNEILITTAKVSGIAGDEAAAAARQFAQALGSGVLQGDELRSILENNQELARQLAAGLGVSIGELRKLGAEGKLTADVVTNALLDRLPEIQSKLKDVPLTTADGFTALRNELTLFIVDLDAATGASTRFAGALQGTANAVGNIRAQLSGDWLDKLKGLNNIAAIINPFTAGGTALAGARAAADRPVATTNLRAIEQEMEAINAAAEKGALGVANTARIASEATKKYADDFLSKQDKIRLAYTEQWTAIDRAVAANKELAKTSAVGSPQQVAALTEITRLEQQRERATAGMTKQLKEADAVEAKRTGSMSAAEKQAAKLADTYEDLEVASKAGLSVESVRKLQELAVAYDQGAVKAGEYAKRVDEILAKDKVLIAEQQALDNAKKALIKTYDDEAKAQNAGLAAYDKSIDAIDREAEKVREQAAVMGLSKTALQAREVAILDNTIALKEQTLAELQSRDSSSESIAMMEREIESLKGLRQARDQLRGAETGQAQIEATKKAVDQQRKDYEDLYNYIDDVGRQAFAALTDSGGNAAKKITEVFKTQLLAFLYKLAVQPFVVNIAASLTGQGAGGITGAGGGLGNLVSGGFDIVKMFSGASSAIGSFLTGAGSGIGGLLGLSAPVAEIAGGLSLGVEAAGAIGTSLTSMGAAFASVVPVVGAIAGAAFLAYQLFSKPRGGPKDGGFASVGDISGISNTDSGGRWFTPNTADSDVTKTVDAISKGYQDAMKALGLTAGNVGFALGYDSDPKGTAPSNVHAGTFVNGQQVYNSENPNIAHGDSEALAAAIALETKRTLFAAIQASLGDAPEYIKQLFDGVDAAGITSEEVDRILSTAQALKTVVDVVGQMGDRFSAMDPAAMTALVDAFGGLQGFMESAAFLQDAFTTDADKAAQATKALNDAFANLGVAVPATHQAFTDLLAGRNLTTEEGRNMYASLSQLAPLFVHVNGTAQEAADAMAEASREAADAAAELAEQERALTEARQEAIQSAQDFFAANFYSGDEQAATRIAAAWDQVHAAWAENEIQLRRLGYEAIPTTNEGFRALIEGIDTSTESGRALYDALILLAPTIFGLNADVASLAEEAEQAAPALQATTDALAGLYQAAQEAAQAFASMFQSIKGAIDSVVSESGGDLGDKLALQTTLYGEQIKRVQDLMRAEIAKNPYSPLIQQYQETIALLSVANNKSAQQLARFTILKAQYGSEMAEQLVQLEDWYKTQKAALGGSVEALAALDVIFKQKWADILAGVSGGVDGTLEQLEKLRQGIREYLDSLRQSDLSPDSPLTKLANAKKLYEEQLKLAQGGDLDALANITKYSDDYLKIARQIYAGTSGYNTVFDQIVTQLGALITPASAKDASGDPLTLALPKGSPISSQADIQALRDELKELRKVLADSQDEAIKSNSSGLKDVASKLERSPDYVPELR